ncbi:hypothetical protein Sgly_1703 [Syntrophobotulus glycolicus DSM 8271]|uniref:Uncharacterized protein n=1 Tax=Syntrophobotulus glycolicus (strain DSM 8271 / FlGlyR) TaxID=645991 RepID=F0SYW3_SYNGF|nr:hypothetical protein [Syntrophobotulus glycolicus]ADY56000.1 hypothetical protein Sgly_1703 [Syntrophobotulus glycolicus DSM 8271]
MINDLWPILVIIIAVFFAFKFFKSIIKLVLILALILIGLIVFFHLSKGTPSFDSLSSKIQSQVMEQSSEQALNTLVEKLKGMDREQVEAYLKDSQSELTKYGLTIDNVKNALKESQ